MNTIRGMMTTLDRMIDEWQQKRHDFEKVKDMMKNSRFELIFSMLDEINDSIYDFFSTTPSAMLTQEIESPDFIFKNLINGSIVLFILVWIIAFFSINWKLLELSIRFHSVPYVIPKKLIWSNMLLVHHLKKVKNGINLY